MNAALFTVSREISHRGHNSVWEENNKHQHQINVNAKGKVRGAPKPVELMLWGK